MENRVSRCITVTTVVDGQDGAPGSQGPQGDGAAEVYVSPGSITVPCNNSGSVVAQMQQRLSLSMYVGNKVATISSVTATCPTGVSVAAQGTSTKDVTITTSATADGMATGIVFTVVGTVDSKEYTATATVPLIGSKQGNTGPQGYGIMLTLTRSYNESQWESISGVGNEENFSYTGDVTLRAGDYFVVKGISTDAHLTHVVTFICTNQTASIVYGTCVSAVCDGKQGQKGDTGPMFYLCGEWADGTEYERTKQRCPVVYDGGKYWYLENEGTSTGDTPGSSSSVWEEAENFNMVFTDVLFVKNFAKLGSGIISGDWLISCAGYIVVNGVKTYYGPEDEYGNAPAYMQFDEDYPDSDNGQNNFMPVYAVDLATGVTYQQKAHIQGSLRASLFEYKVYSSSDAGVGYNVPADADYYYFSYPYGQASTTLQVTLPYAGDMPGKMITLIQPYSDELDWNQIRLYGKDENGDPYGVFVILDANHQPSSGTGYPIGKCSKVVVWADPADCANNGGTWHILEQPMHIRAILKEEGLIS